MANLGSRDRGEQCQHRFVGRGLIHRAQTLADRGQPLIASRPGGDARTIGLYGEMIGRHVFLLSEFRF